MSDQYPVVLIYKRTHTGDPDSGGTFGIHDCMGKVRKRKFDAVIGIGGIQPWKDHQNISQKINWIGIGPTFHPSNDRAPRVTFDRFCLFDACGKIVEDFAPKLYQHMYKTNRRVVMSTSLPADIYEEVLKILDLAKDSPPSKDITSGPETSTQFGANNVPTKTQTLSNSTRGCGCGSS